MCEGIKNKCEFGGGKIPPTDKRIVRSYEWPVSETTADLNRGDRIQARGTFKHSRSSHYIPDTPCFIQESANKGSGHYEGYCGNCTSNVDCEILKLVNN